MLLNEAYILYAAQCAWNDSTSRCLLRLPVSLFFIPAYRQQVRRAQGRREAWQVHGKKTEKERCQGPPLATGQTSRSRIEIVFRSLILFVIIGLALVREHLCSNVAQTILGLFYVLKKVYDIFWQSWLMISPSSFTLATANVFFKENRVKAFASHGTIRVWKSLHVFFSPVHSWSCLRFHYYVAANVDRAKIRIHTMCPFGLMCHGAFRRGMEHMHACHGPAWPVLSSKYTILNASIHFDGVRSNTMTYLREWRSTVNNP